MKAVLILDVETTGLGPNDRVVEVGAVLWSVLNKTTVASYSSLVDGTSNAAQHVNGIPPAALAEGADEASVWQRLSLWLARADALVAHSAEFDRGFTPKGWDQGKPWICSMHDIEWPQHSSSKSLVAMLLQHGLGVSHAHRALTDCGNIARLLERCAEMGHDVEDMLRQAARPKILYRAVVSFAEKDAARAAGFTWNATTKQWTRKLCEENATAFPFKTEKVA
jgi:DNA polymerase-3 subunit epsilon